MNNYEGLFIFSHTLKEEALKEASDRIAAEIGAAGGKVETIQKMDKRPFARVASKKAPSGFYVNYIFSAPQTAIDQLRRKLALNEDVFRVMFSKAAPVQPAPAPAAVPK